MSDGKVRIFFSSPGDVRMERETARRIVERVNQELAGRWLVEPYFWEHEVMVATKDYQENIPAMDGFNLVVCILWSRLGTPLHPERHPRANGGYYESGTEYEFATARDAHARSGTPDILVFRNMTEPRRPSRPREDREAADRELDRLDRFFERYFRDDEFFVAALNEYRTLGEFEDRLALGIRGWVEAMEASEGGKSLIRSGNRSVRRKLYAGRPYLGLSAFGEEDAGVFFGRTAQIGAVVEVFRKQDFEARADEDRAARFVMIVGASGSGKSSLARAGVLPMLTRPGVVEGISCWRTAVVRPGDGGVDPLLALSLALTAPGALPELAADGAGSEEIRSQLARQPDAAGLWLRQALAQAGASERTAREREIADRLRRLEAENRLEDIEHASAELAALTAPSVRLVLLIDQWEELFTSGATDDGTGNFVSVVKSLAASGRVFVLGTLRSDFYATAIACPTLAELMRGEGTYGLPAAGPAELGQMIREPAAAAGLVFESNDGTGEKLDELLRDAALRDPAALPLLGYTLEQLYERRRSDGMLTLATYHELGGLEGAIGSRAEEIYSVLDEEAKDAFDLVWRQLVSLGMDGVAVRRRAADSAVAVSSAAQRMIDQLLAARLLTADAAPDGTRTIAVAHEALLRHWPRVVRFIEANRNFLRVRAKVSQRLADWLEHHMSDDWLIPRGPVLAEAESMMAGHQTAMTSGELTFIRRSAERVKLADHERLRVARRIAIGAVVLCIFAVLAGGVAWRERGQAETARTQAVSEQRAAEEAARRAMLSEFRSAYISGGQMLRDGKSRDGMINLARALTLRPDHPGSRARLYSQLLYGPPMALPSHCWTTSDGLRQRISGTNANSATRCAFLTGVPGGVHIHLFDLEKNLEIEGPWQKVRDSIAAVTSANGDFMLSISTDFQGTMWRVADGFEFPQIPIGANFTTLASSHDGRRWIVGDSGGTFRLYESASGKLLESWTQRGTAFDVQVSRDSRHAVAVSDEWRILDLEDGSEIARSDSPDEIIESVRISGDSTTLVVCSSIRRGAMGQTYRFHTIDDGSRLSDARELEAAGVYHDMAVSNDGSMLVTATFSSGVNVFHRSDSSRDRLITMEAYPLRALLSADERVVFLTDSSGTVWTYRADDGRQVYRPIRHNSLLEEIVISNNGRYLLTSTATEAHCWDLTVGTGLALPILIQGQSEDPAAALIPLPEGKFLTALDRGLTEWNALSHEPIAEAPFATGIRRAAWAAAAGRGALAFADGSLALVEIGTAAPREISRSPTSALDGIAISPDGKSVAAIAPDAIVLLSENAGKLELRWSVPRPAGLGELHFLGKALLAATTGSSLALWEVADGEPVIAGAAPASLGSVLAHPQNGMLVVASSGTGFTSESNVLVWNASAPTAPPLVLPHSDRQYVAAFSPDGKCLITGGMGQAVRVWDLTTLRQACEPLVQFQNAIQAIATHPDGERIAIATADGIISIWDWRNGIATSENFPFAGEIAGLAFEPDGSRLTAWSALDDKLRVAAWETDPHEITTASLLRLTEIATSRRLVPGRIPEPSEPFRSISEFREIAGTEATWFLKKPFERSISPQYSVPGKSWLMASEISYSQILDAMPMDPTAHAAIAFWNQSSLQEKIDSLTSSADSEISDSLARDITTQTKQISGGTELARQNIEISPQIGYFLSRLAELSDSNTDAVACIEIALKLAPRDDSALSQAANLYEQLGEWEKLLAVRRFQLDLAGADPSPTLRAELVAAAWAMDEIAMVNQFGPSLLLPAAGTSRIPADDLKPRLHATLLAACGQPESAARLLLGPIAAARDAGDPPDMYLLDRAAYLWQAGSLEPARSCYRELIAIESGAANVKIIENLQIQPKIRKAALEILHSMPGTTRDP